MAKVLTQAALDALKPSDKRREIPDAKASGLYHIIQPTGVRSWAYRYKIGRTSRKLTLGPFPLVSLAAARDLARKAAAERVDGIDPAAKKKAAKVARRASEPALDLIEAVVETYVERYAKRRTRERTWRETERLLKREVVSAWRGRSIAAIRRKDIVALLDPISDRAPVVANRTLSALHGLCGWAVERGLLEANPCIGVRPPSKETSRERVLSDQELATLWRTAETIGYPYGPLIKFLALTEASRSVRVPMVRNRLRQGDLESACGAGQEQERA
jgi:hypothetical protein